jgi:Tfp pilus assembly protein PilN
MSSFRMGAVVFLFALSINAYAAETPAEAEKLNRDFLRLTAENAELKKKVKELDLAKADCIQVLEQYQRAAKDD